jgi:hypothetical protein
MTEVYINCTSCCLRRQLDIAKITIESNAVAQFVTTETTTSIQKMMTFTDDYPKNVACMRSHSIKGSIVANYLRLGSMARQQ